MQNKEFLCHATQENQMLNISSLLELSVHPSLQFSAMSMWQHHSLQLAYWVRTYTSSSYCSTLSLRQSKVLLWAWHMMFELCMCKALLGTGTCFYFLVSHLVPVATCTVAPQTPIWSCMF